MNNFNEIYKNYRGVIDRELDSIDLPAELSYFRESLLYPLKGQGKRFRPILLLTVGKSLGQNEDQLMPAALAIEILHPFTLVHDDIMDNDEMRRGLPTVHNKWDQPTAILSGDGLFALAYRQLMQLQLPVVNKITTRISDALLKICEGQIRDLNFENRIDVLPQEYLDMVDLKTGELIGLSCAVGAIIAGASEELIEKLNNFGKILGQAFQIQDDILEISSDEEQMGKSLGSDFAAGKKTYPLTIILSKVDEEEKKNIMSFLQNNSYNKQEVMEKFEQYDAIQQGKALIDQLISKALSELDGCPEHTKSQLRYFVELISNREH